VTDLYIMGLATDYCVKFTALDARQQDFNVHLIQDGCRGVELHPGDIARAIDEMKSAGVHVIDSASI
jgi:nicotinamidase/pyrazinamidase